MTPHLDQEFHHLTSPKKLSRQWGAPQSEGVRPRKMTVLISHADLSSELKRHRFNFSNFLPGLRFIQLAAWVTRV
jgi:hypothetical protein